MRYARRLPSTGPTAIAFFGAYLVALVYGLYNVGQGNQQRRGYKAGTSRYCPPRQPTRSKRPFAESNPTRFEPMLLLSKMAASCDAAKNDK